MPLTFPLDLTLFGLTKETAAKVRYRLYEEIHEIVYYGGGGYTHSDVFNMPTWLRKFTYNEILESLKKKNEGSNENTVIDKDGLVRNKTIFKSQATKPKFNTNQNTPKRPPTYK